MRVGHDVPVDSWLILLWTMAKSLLLIRQEIVNICRIWAAMVIETWPSIVVSRRRQENGDTADHKACRL
jgi:hypothetical protein